jgi:hypothetical protein
MSDTHDNQAPEGIGTRSILTRLGIGTGVIAGITALAIVVWPDSEADKARADGEQFGAAVAQLEQADSQAAADDALAEIRDAAVSTRDHAGDSVANQVDDQADALDRAVDGYTGMLTTDSDWDYELYDYELEVALDDLSNNASDFREEGPEVQQAFWDGFEDGYSA